MRIYLIILTSSFLYLSYRQNTKLSNDFEKKAKINKESRLSILDLEEDEEIPWYYNFWIPDSIYYGLLTTPSGFYKNEGNKGSFVLNICGYRERTIEGLRLSPEAVDSILLPYSLSEYKFRKKCTVRNQKGKIANKIHRVYYEIADLENGNEEKIVGKLYQFGSSGCMNKYINGGEVYISDTTALYGWFIITVPMSLGWGKHTRTVQSKLQVKSKNLKAQKICGSYNQTSFEPYRIIRDEEVESKNTTR